MDKYENLKNILRELENRCDSHPDKFIFNEPAGVMELIDFEVEYDLKLPLSFIIFLEEFNGGFISLLGGERSSRDLETARWNSNHIFSLDEIAEEYEKLSDINWKLAWDFKGVYPFIPFCHTSTGELLVFVNSANEKRISPVFDANHEEFPCDWGSLYSDFSEFMIEYVNNNGIVKTISYDEPTAEQYLSER